MKMVDLLFTFYKLVYALLFLRMFLLYFRTSLKALKKLSAEKLQFMKVDVLNIGDLKQRLHLTFLCFRPSFCC